MPADRPLPLFREALAARNLEQAMRLAKLIPIMSLADAARLIELMAKEDTAEDLFERSALRWLSRFLVERRGMSLQLAGSALQALDALGEDPAALGVLLELVT